MLVLYLFGSCPKIHATLALVHKEGVLCIIRLVATSDAIKRVTLSSPNVVCTGKSMLGKCSAICTMASSNFVGSSVMLSLHATNNMNQWFLLHVACRGGGGQGHGGNIICCFMFFLEVVFFLDPEICSCNVISFFLDLQWMFLSRAIWTFSHFQHIF